MPVSNQRYIGTSSIVAARLKGSGVLEGDESWKVDFDRTDSKVGG